MDNLEKLALLTDGETRACLNAVLKALSARQTALEPLFASPKDMERVLEFVAAEAATEFRVANEGNREAKDIRALLVEMASQPDLAPYITAYFESKRTRLLEPVTSALVLAGIIGVLSTDLDVEVSRKDGQLDFKVKLRKKPTAAKLLAKLAALFA